MKNLFILFLLSIATISQAHTIEPEKKAVNSWDIVLNFDANNCTGSRAIWSQLYTDLNAIYAQVGANIAITQITAYSWENLGGVPLCTCRGSNTLAKINVWESNQGLPLSTNSIQSCIHNNNAGVATYPEFQKVVIHIEAFL